MEFGVNLNNREPLITSDYTLADLLDLAELEEQRGACAEQASAGCAPLPDGEASPDYLRHLVAVYARQALGEAFSAS